MLALLSISCIIKALNIYCLSFFLNYNNNNNNRVPDCDHVVVVCSHFRRQCNLLSLSLFCFFMYFRCLSRETPAESMNWQKLRLLCFVICLCIVYFWKKRWKGLSTKIIADQTNALSAFLKKQSLSLLLGFVLCFLGVFCT